MITINKPILGIEEEEAVIKSIRKGELTNASYMGGANVKAAEEMLIKYLGVKHAIMVNSGTAALQASLMALGVKPGDEVLLPSLTFAATANAILTIGAHPIFVDISPEDFCIDPSDLIRKVTNKSKVVIPVHLYGYPAKMRILLDLAVKKKLFVVEDAAQSLGATYEAKQTGTFGDLGCFSFYPSKVITSGEGGAVVTGNDELADRLRMVRNHGMSKDSSVKIFGMNLRLPELSGAILCCQMKKLDVFLKARRKNAEILTKLLADVEGIVLPTEEENRKSNWYLYTVRIRKNRDKILESLHQAGVGAAVYYSLPIHLQPLYQKMGIAKLPETEKASREVISLPIHPAVCRDDLTLVASKLQEALRTTS